ncbi:MAG: hypothetical protein J0G33_02875 [Afipia felis]|nr:hypothetical protein [Afipia felis]
MACNCIDEIDAKLAEHNSKLEVGFTLGSEERHSFVFPALRTEKIDKRNRKKMGAIPTFCPFCGTRYREASPATEKKEG